MVSEAAKAGDVLDLQTVLILVLVEDGLGATILFAEKYSGDGVLILVLVEDGLGERHIRRVTY